MGRITQDGEAREEETMSGLHQVSLDLGWVLRARIKR